MIESHCNYHHSAMCVCVCVRGGEERTTNMNRHTLNTPDKIYTVVCELGGGGGWGHSTFVIRGDTLPPN